MNTKPITCAVTAMNRRDTPEEQVRQRFLNKLLTVYGYSKQRLAVEFRIKVGSAWKSVDIAIFRAGKTHEQQNIELIVECKSGRTSIVDSERDQLYSYGAACVNCKWLSIVSGENHEIYQKIKRNGDYELIQYDDIPGSTSDGTRRPSPTVEGKRVGTTHMSFDEAKTHAASLRLEEGIRSSTAWKKFARQSASPRLPVYPDRLYANTGWNGWPDFFGKKFLPFDKARDFVRKLNLSGDTAWRKYAKSGKRPEDIPSNPNNVYRNEGYTTLGDWLGTSNVSNAKKTYRDFANAHKFVLNLRLATYKEWQSYCAGKKRGQIIPKDIPKSPYRRYKKDWIDWQHWLTGKPRQYSDFREAQSFVHGLQLKSAEQWNQWVRENGAQHPNIPRAPHQFYKGSGWISWPDWLGTCTVATKDKQFLSFHEAREYVRKLQLRGERAWRAYSKGDRKNDLGERPSNIPTNPDKYYQLTGWTSWRDWLGSDQQ
jgi:hypothetical protein